jgi:hypothetical protein
MTGSEKIFDHYTGSDVCGRAVVAQSILTCAAIVRLAIQLPVSRMIASNPSKKNWKWDKKRMWVRAELDMGYYRQPPVAEVRRHRLLARAAQQIQCLTEPRPRGSGHYHALLGVPLGR